MPRCPEHALPVFLQEDNVGRDFGASVGLESRVWQPYGPDQVCAFGQILPDGRILFVHGVAARNQRHHTAGPRLVERLGKEIIVNGPRNGRTTAISGIEHWIPTEWDVANYG